MEKLRDLVIVKLDARTAGRLRGLESENDSDTGFHQIQALILDTSHQISTKVEAGLDRTDQTHLQPSAVVYGELVSEGSGAVAAGTNAPDACRHVWRHGAWQQARAQVDVIDECVGLALDKVGAVGQSELRTDRQVRAVETRAKNPKSFGSVSS